MQTGQSVRIQDFQWEMIWRDDAQWGTKAIGRTNHFFDEAEWNPLNINWNYILYYPEIKSQNHILQFWWLTCWLRDLLVVLKYDG